jgi:putative acetyltransferase
MDEQSQKSGKVPATHRDIKPQNASRHIVQHFCCEFPGLDPLGDVCGYQIGGTDEQARQEYCFGKTFHVDDFGISSKFWKINSNFPVKFVQVRTKKNKLDMLILKRTHSEDDDFVGLVRQLDAELAEIDGSDHSFYAQFNKIDRIRHAIVAYENGKPIGCGAIKELEPGAMEVKRMYTIPARRRAGVAGKILSGLESWAAELSFEKCVLETGKRQPEAIALYQRYGYGIIPNYGQYAGVENSVCFEKKIKKTV